MRETPTATTSHATDRAEGQGPVSDAPRRESPRYAMSLPYREDEDVIRLAGEEASLLLPRGDDEALRTYLRWLSDERTNMWVQQSARTWGMEAEREWFQRTSSNPDAHSYNILDMRRRRIVGNCSARMHGTTSVVGILIGDPGSRGHGLGTAVMRMLVRYSFEELGAHRVELSVMAENERAMRCYAKVGFVECGRRHEEHWYGGAWHDSVDMEILRGHWEEGLRDRR